MIKQYSKNIPIFITLLLTILGMIAIFINSIVYYHQQYAHSTMALLDGHFYLSRNIPDIEYYTDSIEKNGERYFTLNPGPIILLIIPSFFSKILGFSFFPQGYIQILLLLSIFLSTYKLAKWKNFSDTDSTYLAIAFVFASPLSFVGTIPWSWYFAHIVAIFFSLLGIQEYHNKKRFLLIGIYISLVFMSRFTAGCISVYFLLCLIFNSREKIKTRILNLIKILLPIIVSMIFLLIYNKIRFGNILDNGYLELANNMYYKDFDLDDNNGLFSLRYIARNFYYYFLKPTLGFPSTGFFFLYPFYLYIFKLKLNTRENKIILSSTIFILISLLTYYWPGWIQIGPRYLLDLFPLLYLGLLQVFKDKKVPILGKYMIILSALVNIILTINMLFI